MKNKQLDWITKQSQYIIKDTWATVRADTCERPDGKIIKPYYVYEFSNWVTALALTSENKVILERQYRHALGKTIIEIPGGCVDASDTSLEDAIARELAEETGYVFERYHYLGSTSANPSTNNNLMHMFIAFDGQKTKEQQFDEGEDLEVIVVSFEEMAEMLFRGDFVQSMHATCLYRALQYLGKLKYMP